MSPPNGVTTTSRNQIRNQCEHHDSTGCEGIKQSGRRDNDNAEMKSPIQTQPTTDDKTRHSEKTQLQITLTNPAEIRILVVPFGSISPQKFTQCIEAISKYSIIPTPRIIEYLDSEVSEHYSSIIEKSGCIRLRYTTTFNEDHSHLEPLQAFRRVYGIVSLVDSIDFKEFDFLYDKHSKQIEKYKSAVFSQLFAIDVNDLDLTTSKSANTDSLVVCDLSNLKSHVTKFAAKVVNNINHTIDSIDMQINDISGAGDRNVKRNMSNGGALNKEHDTSIIPKFSQQIHRAQSITSDLRSKSIPLADERNKASNSFGVNTAVKLKRQTSIPIPDDHSGDWSEGSDITFGRKACEMEKHFRADISVSQIPSPTNSLASGKSTRIRKLQADLLLMSGRLVEAVTAYSTCTKDCKLAKDVLCYTVALEAYSTTLLCLSYQIPARDFLKGLLISPPITTFREHSRIKSSMDLGSRSEVSSTPKTAQTDSVVGHKSDNQERGGATQHKPSAEAFTSMADFEFVGFSASNTFEVLCRISTHFAEVPLMYEEMTSFVPLLHSEACIRESLFLLSLHKYGPRGAYDVLKTLLGERSFGDNATNMKAAMELANTKNDMNAQQHKVPLPFDIAQWAQRAWTHSLQALPYFDQLSIFSHINVVFSELGMRRKQMVFIYQLVTRAAEALEANDTKESTDSADIAPLSLFSTADDAFVNFAYIIQISLILKRITIKTDSRSNGRSRQDGYRDSFLVLLRSRIRKFVARIENICFPDNKLLFGDNSDHDMLKGFSEVQLRHPSLQYSILLKCISLCESFGDYDYASGITLSLLDRLQALIDAQSQFGTDSYFKSAQSRVLTTLTQLFKRHHTQTTQHIESTVEKDSLAGMSLSPTSHHLNGTFQAVAFREEPQVDGSVYHPKLVNIEFKDGVALSVLSSLHEKSHSKAPLFIYNPSDKGKAKQHRTLIANEIAYITLYVFNPFSFNIVVSGIKLVLSSSTQISSKNQDDSRSTICYPCILSSDITINPKSLIHIQTKFIPEHHGTLSIKAIECLLFKHLNVTCPLSSKYSCKLATKETPKRRSRSLIDRDPASSTSSLDLLDSFIISPPLPKLVPPSSTGIKMVPVYEGQEREFMVKLSNTTNIAPAVVGVEVVPLSGISSTLNARYRPNKFIEFIRVMDSPASKDPKNPGLKLQFSAFGLPDCSGAKVTIKYTSKEYLDSIDQKGHENTMSLYIQEITVIIHLDVIELITPSFDSWSTFNQEGITASYSRCIWFSPLSKSIAKSGLISCSPTIDELLAMCDNSWSVLASNMCVGYFSVYTTTDLNIKLKITAHCSFISGLSDKEREKEDASDGLITSEVFLVPGKTLQRFLFIFPRIHIPDSYMSRPIPGPEQIYELDEGENRWLGPWNFYEPVNTLDINSPVPVSTDNKHQPQLLMSCNYQGKDSRPFNERFLYWYQCEIWKMVRLQWYALEDTDSGQQRMSGYINPCPYFKLDDTMMTIGLKSTIEISANILSTNNKKGSKISEHISPEETLTTPLSAPKLSYSFLSLIIKTSHDISRTIWISIRQAGQNNYKETLDKIACAPDLEASFSEDLFVESVYPPPGNLMQTATTIENITDEKQQNSELDPFRINVESNDEHEPSFGFSDVAPQSVYDSKLPVDLKDDRKGDETHGITNTQSKKLEVIFRAQETMGKCGISDYSKDLLGQEISGSRIAKLDNPIGFSSSKEDDLIWEPLADYPIRLSKEGKSHTLQIPVYFIRSGKYFLVYDISTEMNELHQTRHTGNICIQVD
ncbi:hypothetical protein H4219_000491 [Mycoemilia scoparia]|uniref:Uncharacterized protein n=1 Tax=Mycoemilia scoparia TaxID=417184 RepID=A0A9W8A8I7_9FUNG|nr:hypothetical protein H4219_000491 [Mycoemilia scoparia]